MANIDLKGDFLDGQPLKILTDLMNGSRRMAIGTVAEFWELAQHYWADGEKLIPHKVFSIRGFPKELYEPEIGLAEYREDGIYAKGSAERFDWLLQRRLAGRVGGKKKAENLAKLKREASEKLASATANHHKIVANAIAPVPVPVPEKKSSCSKKSDIASQRIAALYCELFKNHHGVNPRLNGRDIGQLKSFCHGLSQEKCELYLSAYFSMPDARIQGEKHPPSLLLMHKSKILVFAETGDFVTQQQMRQGDSRITNALLEERIRNEESKIGTGENGELLQQADLNGGHRNDDRRPFRSEGE